MPELDNLEQESASPKKAAKIDKNSTPSRQRKKKEGTTEIDHNEKTTMKNTTKKPDGTFNALYIPAVDRAQTSMTKPRALVSFGLDEQLE